MFTVLIVDDTKENIKVLASLLEKQYKTIIANSGEKALTTLKKRTVDLILLDVLMPPGINGFETCVQIKEDHEIPDTPVIFITALNDKESLMKGFSVGGVDYITKPFMREEVLARVKVHVEHHSMVRARNEMIKGLDQVVKERDLEFANMSHELRTPLNAIIGYGEMISDDIDYETKIDSKALQTDLKKIITSSHYLLKLVNDILDLSKIEADRMNINCATLPILEVIDEVVSICHQLVEKNNNTLIVENQSNKGVVANYTRVQQILLNLLSNACKFTANGTIKIILKEIGKNQHITVSDTGRGMTEEEQTNIFKPFSQANKQTSAEYGGTGLGLALSKKFAELMGGSIKMKSEFAKGSEFTLVLPVVE